MYRPDRDLLSPELVPAEPAGLTEFTLTVPRVLSYLMTPRTRLSPEWSGREHRTEKYQAESQTRR
jgi:hypothetical protein